MTAERTPTYAERGIERKLLHARGAGTMFPEGQRWLYRAIGPWRPSEDAVTADLALLEADRLAPALKLVLFLATEEVAEDPNPEELAALLVVMALVDVLEVADEQA